MTDLPIPASAIEAAAEALLGRRGDSLSAMAEAALRAAFEELGMEREWERVAKAPACDWRLVSRWMPVEES